jgi:GTP-binding protein EngB required for normal cell division
VLGGATGVGKSSLFNALVGIGLSPVAVRRPTTAEPLACVWEAERLEEARPLLDRIGVDPRKQLCRESPLDLGVRRPGAPLPARDPLAGLVLVDLPDHDSAATQHRVSVDRAVEFADLLIWVTDPQKYADASWHDDYLKPLSSHGGVTLILLNQVDRLPPGTLPECLADLRRLVDADGLTEAPIWPVSARTGEGLDRLREHLSELVAGRQAAADRLGADVAKVAVTLAPLINAGVETAGIEGAGVEGAERGLSGEVPDADRERTLAGLRAAAGVSSLADAVAARAAARALPLVSSPLRALGRFWRGDPQAGPRLPAPDAPAAVPVDRGGLDQVLGQFAGAVTQQLPADWGRTLRTKITGSRRDVAEHLDLALGQCELAAVDGVADGTGAARAGHVLLLVLAAAGLVGGLGGVAGPLPGFAAPLGGLALLLGVGGSLLLDVRARATARARAIRAGQVAAGSLSVELAAVAQDSLFAPAAAELERHRRANEAFAVVRA